MTRCTRPFVGVRGVEELLSARRIRRLTRQFFVLGLKRGRRSVCGVCVYTDPKTRDQGQPAS